MTELTHFIINCLSTDYWIEVATLALLTVGADTNAYIYKVHDTDQNTYFVKLKRGHFNDANIAILELLQIAGIQQLIPPVKTREGKEIQQTEEFTVIVYPFVQGQDGFTRSLTDDQWIDLGKALKQVHQIDVPKILQTRIRREEFSPKWRDAVRSVYQLEALSTDEIALGLRKFLQENRSIIQRLVDRSEQLSQKVRNQPLKLVLCHSDIHGGNVLVDDKGALYIVDWDEPILAPKERDLMFIGGGVGNVWNKPQEERLFYQGYGPTDVDLTLLTYYRFERIVEDIAVYCQELLFEPTDGKDKFEMYKHFMDMFALNGVVDIAFATDKHRVE